MNLTQAVASKFTDLTNADNKASVLNVIRHAAEEEGGGRLEFYKLDQDVRNQIGPRTGSSSSIADYLDQMKKNMDSVVMVVDGTIPFNECENNPDMVEIPSMLLRDRKISYSYQLCYDINYGDQPSARSEGSGFFVGTNIIATAAHVILQSKFKLSDVRFISGVYKNGDSGFKDKICVHKSKVFQPVDEALDPHQYYFSELGSDFAVLAVKPSYPGVTSSQPSSAPSLAVMPKDITIYNQQFEHKALKGRELYSLGHGLGLSLKVSYDGTVIRVVKHMPYFETNLSLLGGNSGSPVFDAITHELLGIYVRGTKKLTLIPSGRFMKNGVFHQGECLDVKPETANSSHDGAEGQECQRLEFVAVALAWVKNKLSTTQP